MLHDVLSLDKGKFTLIFFFFALLIPNGVGQVYLNDIWKMLQWLFEFATN